MYIHISVCLNSPQGKRRHLFSSHCQSTTKRNKLQKVTYTVYQMLQVSAFPSALGHTPEAKGRAPAPRESTARWHTALTFPRQHAQPSLNEFLLSSPWADPTQQQFCNTCCSQIHHLNPQTTFANFLGNCQPFFPMGIFSEELLHNCCQEGSSGGHLAWPLSSTSRKTASTAWGQLQLCPVDTLRPRKFFKNPQEWKLHNLSSFHCYLIQVLPDLYFSYLPLKCLTPLLTSRWDLNGSLLASFKTPISEAVFPKFCYVSHSFSPSN